MGQDRAARGGARRGLGRGRRSARPGRSLSSLPYLPGLDGMRALAVVAVMVYHANHDWLPGGFLGVEVFFVISGYLITLLLVGEHERTGRISLRQFWARRARRLLPALFFMLLLVITYTWIWEREELGRLRGDVFAGLGYVSNWYQIWVGQGYTAASAFAPLRHLWSLAVEEQFYLFWPIVMAVLIRLRGQRRLPNLSRWLVFVAIGITVAAGLLFEPGRELAVDGTPVADQFWHVGDRAISRTDTLYLSTITRSTGLLIGAAFALIWRPRAVMRGPLRNKGLILDVLAIIGLASLAALVWSIHLVTPDGADPMLFRGGLLAVGFATVFVMSAVTHGATWSGPVLGNPLFNWIGTRSYGLYLYHWPIYQGIRKAAGNPLSIGEFAIAMAITVVITEFSYRVLEMPIRRRQLPAWMQRVRHRRAPIRRLLVAYGTVACLALFGVAGANMATAKLQPSEQELAQQEGEDVVVDFGDQLALPAGSEAGPAEPEEGTPGPDTTVGTAGPSTSDTFASTTPSTAATDVAATTDGAASTLGSIPSSESTDAGQETTQAVGSTDAAETTDAAESTDASETSDAVPTTDVAASTETATPDLASNAATDDETTAAPDTTERAGTSTTVPWSTDKEIAASEPPFPSTTSTSSSTTTTAPTTASPTTAQPTTAAPTTAAPTTAAPTTAAPTTAPLPTAPPEPRTMLAIGDSVMLGAAPNLAEAGYVVDAAVSRQMLDYVPVLQGAAARDQIPDVVVVHLGTNGRFSTDTMHAFFDALASADLVVVLTVHADRGWTAHNNELIMTLPERYSNVRIIDWNTLVGQCEGNCLYDDGIHLPPAGRRYYAQLIFDVVGP